MLLSQNETREFCAQVLGRVKADDAIVRVSSASNGNQRFANGSLTTNAEKESIEVALTVWRQGRKGTASTSELSKSALDALAREAERVADVSAVDEEYVPTLPQQKYRPVPAAFDRNALGPSAQRRAKAVHKIFKLADEAGVVVAGLMQSSASASGSLTRHGNFEYGRRSFGSLSLTARLPDGSSSGYYFRSAVDPNDLDPSRIAHEAIRRATSGRNPQVLSPGNYSVILEPQAVSELLIYFYMAFAARQADEGRNAMSASGGKTKVGQQLFDNRLSFYSDPWHAEIPGWHASDEGIPAEKFFLVRDGTVENLVYSRYWAKEKNRPPTPGPVNVILEGSGKTESLESMISGSERALLVTRFWYENLVDPRSLLVTGLTRDGVWLVEDGKIKHPVRNFRFNQSLMQMFAPGNVEHYSKPERINIGDEPVLVPALKLRQFHFTSASEAV